MNIHQKNVELYQKFLRGACNPTELQQLCALFGTLDLQQLESMVVMELSNTGPIDVQQDDLKRYSQIFANISSHIQHKKIRTRMLWYRVAAAASVILIFSFAVALYYAQPQRRRAAIASTPVKILPGSSKAFLTLSNGQVIDLRSKSIKADNNLEKGVAISNEDGLLKYSAGALSIYSGTKNTTNQIHTPLGGEYRLILPDGTKVWLNAASSLTYSPSLALSNVRKVSLKGEGYFEVAKDVNRPFIVETDDQQIKVLGTHFNVNAYHDVSGSVTTLVEGKVLASGKSNGIILHPNQAVVTNQNGSLSVGNVDPATAIAWKENQFAFESQSLRELMKRLARWYDVEVIYTDRIPEIYFNGAVSKFSNINEVLRLLGSTNKISFEIKGRTVHVKKFNQNIN